MPGFWTGGPKAYREGLAQAAKAEIASLRRRLKTAATEAVRQQLLDRIRDVENDYHGKLRGIDQCRF